MSDQNKEYPRDGTPRRPRNEYYPKAQTGSVKRPRNEYYPAPTGTTNIRPRNESGMPQRPKTASSAAPAKKSAQSTKKKASWTDAFKGAGSKKSQKAETKAARTAQSAPARSYGTSGYAGQKSTVSSAPAGAQKQKKPAPAPKRTASAARTTPRNAASSSIDSYLDTYNKTSDWLDEKKESQRRKKEEAKAQKEAKKARKAERAKREASRAPSKEGTKKGAGAAIGSLVHRGGEKKTSRAAGADTKTRRKTGARLVKAIVLRSLVYLIIAGIISAFIISVANDAFALTKTDTTEVEVNIPDGASTKSIAKILHKNKLIKYEFAYVLYAKMTKEDGTAKFGDFILSHDMTYDNIMTTLKRGPFSETNPNDVRILIPEGYECSQIIDLLVNNGLGSREVFEDVINNHDFGYNFIDRIPADRQGYRLEGYLFPDTYIFSKTEGEVSIIRRMLLNFDRKITVDLYDRMNEIGYSLDDTITLASMIEREAGSVSDMPLISSVFHNRLNSDYRYLESDATLQFVLGERKDLVTYEDTELDNPYNTYQYAGLPPGPIASPGLAAIKAALYPEQTDYFYFVARSDGTSMFATTYEEHQRNVTVASRTWGN
ncbi:MAG: endolytic transglycosylase MltG [Clostridia bacterium]|nr:endolytic transglycosylase MltG [Clostridia bacterium]